MQQLLTASDSLAAIWLRLLGFAWSSLLATSSQVNAAVRTTVENHVEAIDAFHMLRFVPVRGSLTWHQLERHLAYLAKAFAQSNTRETVWAYFTALAATRLLPTPYPWFIKAVTAGLKWEWRAAEAEGRNLPEDWVQLHVLHSSISCGEEFWIDFAACCAADPKHSRPRSVLEVCVEIVQVAVADNF